MQPMKSEVTERGSGIQSVRVNPQMNCDHYAHVADLFDFPRTDFSARGQVTLDMLRDDYPEAAEEVEYFLKVMPQRTIDLQELHTRTFDVQSLTTLDVGYVLFGDDYKRGALLASMNQEHRRLQNDCRGELGDHLPNVLRLIAKLDDPGLIREMVLQLVVPALLLMIREFDSDRAQKKDENYEQHYWTLIDRAPGSDPTIYCRTLNALLYILARDFDITQEMLVLIAESGSRPQTQDFLGQVKKEMDIEMDANPVNSGCDS